MKKCKYCPQTDESFFYKSCTSICKSCHNHRRKEYLKTEKGQEMYRRAGAKWSKKKRQEDPNFRLRMNLRNATKNALKFGNKGGSAVVSLGCSIEEYRAYLESKFQPGMTWDNYGTGKGKWNIDHIQPLSRFDLSDPEQFNKACHFSNTQPLWAHENFIKSNK